MSFFLYYYLRELKNRTIKKNEERKILTCIYNFNVLLFYPQFFFAFFSYFLVLYNESSDDGCGCRRGRHLLTRSSLNDIRCRKKRQGTVKNRRNLIIGNNTKKNWWYNYEKHMCAHDYTLIEKNRYLETIFYCAI
jgi:hypothetical protein